MFVEEPGEASLSSSSSSKSDAVTAPTSLLHPLLFFAVGGKNTTLTYFYVRIARRSVSRNLPGPPYISFARKFSRVLK